MKKSIPLQSGPDYNSLVPPDLGGPSSAPAYSSGIDMNNLSPEEAEAVPDKGTANVGFSVHKRRSETHIHPKTGEKHETHHISMHLHHFEPQPEEQKESPKKKKLTESTNARDAVSDGLSPDGNP